MNLQLVLPQNIDLSKDEALAIANFAQACKPLCFTTDEDGFFNLRV